MYITPRAALSGKSFLSASAMLAAVPIKSTSLPPAAVSSAIVTSAPAFGRSELSINRSGVTKACVGALNVTVHGPPSLPVTTVSSVFPSNSIRLSAACTAAAEAFQAIGPVWLTELTIRLTSRPSVCSTCSPVTGSVWMISRPVVGFL